MTANEQQIQPVILCGGSGTRLWPLSRAGFPKQFLNLVGDESQFQQAVKRLLSIDFEELNNLNPIIVTGEPQRFLVTEQMREIGVELGPVILEPAARNTAPALTLAALAALEASKDPILVVTPADQTIADLVAFTDAAKIAIKQASLGEIVLLGVIPDRPETGYGYIKTSMTVKKSIGAQQVEKFVEKPDAITAIKYITDGNYYWNAGIFVVRARVWMSAIKKFRPDIEAIVSSSWGKRSLDGNFFRPNLEEFLRSASESIDYAVIEKSPGSEFPTKMIPLNAGWSDLGAWDAVWKVLPKDVNGNAFIGDVVSHNSKNNLVHATSRLISVVGVQNTVVIETPDAVLVMDQGACQEIKSITEQLQRGNRDESTNHRKVHRPWGWYDSIDKGMGFKVKRIVVNPNASLSLQRHQHRAEHWIVVRGVARVTCGNHIFELNKNQSTYIPARELHRLQNIGFEPLELIEVQSGDYLDEDDIVRLEDQYGRN